MVRLTDEKLLELLDGTESDRVERKEFFGGDVPKKSRQAVCAFANDLPFDNYPIPSATINDLSRVVFENEYLPRAFAEDVLQENKCSYEERLVACRMIHLLEDTVPTVMGLLAVGKYPQTALQQILYNAVLHRTYEGTNAPVQLFWFNDRIEIRSPGGPYGNVTPENFGEPGAVDYRNPNIADVLKIFGFVQVFGRGIITARSAMEKNGNPPLEFRIDRTSVLCTLRARS